MPIYEYRCTACGHELEILQSVSEKPEKVCPQCKKPKLQKQVSAASFQLKGTGWYATDFKNKGKPEAAKKKGDAASTTSTESKTETKAKPDSGSSAGGSDNAT